MTRALNKDRETKRKTKAAEPAKPNRNLQIALDLQALYRTNPIAARDKILDAFRATGGNAVRAASQLGIGHRTLLRYMSQDPGLDAGVEKIRTEAREARAKAAEKEQATS